MENRSHGKGRLGGANCRAFLFSFCAIFVYLPLPSSPQHCHRSGVSSATGRSPPFLTGGLGAAPPTSWEVHAPPPACYNCNGATQGNMSGNKGVTRAAALLSFCRKYGKLLMIIQGMVCLNLCKEMMIK